MYYAAPPTAMGPAGRRGKSTHRARGPIFCYIIRVGNANNSINPTILSEEFEIQNLIM